MNLNGRPTRGWTLREAAAAQVLRLHPGISIFLFALTLRLICLLQGLDNPLLSLPVLDEAYYLELGRAIAGGQWLGEERAFFMDPLYGYLLAALFSLFGEAIPPVRVLQILCDSLSSVLILEIGTRVWNRRAGIAAGILYALYKVAFFHALLILKTTLGTFLILLFTLGALHAGRTRSPLKWFLLGAGAGVMAHLQAGWLSLLPIVALCYGWVERPAFGEWGRHVLLFAAGGLLLLLPGAFRNHAATGEWVWLNTQSGRLLYASNNPENLTGRYNAPSFSRLHPEESEQDFHREAEKRLGKPLIPSEVSRYWRDQTVEFLVRSPGATFTLARNKIRNTLADHEIPNNHSFYVAARFSPVLRWPLPSFALVLALGIPGLALGLAARRRTGWLLPPILSVLLTVGLFYTSSRFRMPAVPFLVVSSGICIERLAAWATRRERGKAVAVLAAGALLYWGSVALSEPRESGTGEFFLSKAYWSRGSYAEAREEALKGAERFPVQSRFPALLAMIATSEGRFEEAVQHNLEALALEPANADALHNLGLAYVLQGRGAEAVSAVRKAIALTPGARYFFTLGKAWEATGKGAEALEAYTEYLQRSKPSDPFRSHAEERRSILLEAEGGR